MNYKDTCEYLYSQMPMFEKQGASGYKEGLMNTLKLDDHFNHPHQIYRTIHVAGTNGKGSSAHTLAAVLQMCGYKVGLYTSPHLVDFSERIRINGQPIEEDYVIDFVEKEKGFFEPLYPSFFEVVTAMAFKYFADKEVDFAVIEVGMGGRLDCTNIIRPVLSVITNIGLDHTQFLGNSLEQIAENGLVYHTKDYGIIEGELAGSYQEKNTNTVLCAIKQLELQGYMYPVVCQPEQICQNREVKEAFKNVCELTGLKGRWQKIKDVPLTICDTGHNVAGWEWLSKQLKSIPCKRMHIVFGMVEDKDIEGVMALLPKEAIYYFTKSNSKRASSENVLALYAQTLGLEGKSFPDVNTAYEAVVNAADEKDFVFIGGSSYVVADFLKNCI